jgi:hypothetical protein
MDILKKALAMAYSRDAWVRRVRNILAGALGEYAQISFSQTAKIRTDLIPHWEREIKEHFKRIGVLTNPKQTKSKAAFSRSKAFAEAMREATDATDQITTARNKMFEMATTKQQRTTLIKTHLTTEVLMVEMIKKYGKGIKITK